MFTEILRIKPKLSETDAKTMESRLSARFSRVSKRFGQGLKAVIKGSIIGISLGFLAKLLDPLKEVEERIRNLLKQGEDSRELAERFGTDQGKLKKLQDVGRVIGVEPDRLNELMTKYAEAIEKGRTELENNDPDKEKSESTKILGNFLNDKDLANGFFQFIQSLSKADESQRRQVEQEVFGGVQTGSARKLINADFGSEFAKIGGFSYEKIGKSLEKFADLAEKDRIGQVGLENKNILQSSGKIGDGTVKGILARAAREQAQEQKELSQIASMQKAQEGIDEISKLLNQLLEQVRLGFGLVGQFIVWIKGNKFLNKFFGK